MFQMFICLVKLNYTDTNVVMFAFFYNMWLNILLTILYISFSSNIAFGQLNMEGRITCIWYCKMVKT